MIKVKEYNSEFEVLQKINMMNIELKIKNIMKEYKKEQLEIL